MVVVVTLTTISITIIITITVTMIIIITIVIIIIIIIVVVIIAVDILDVVSVVLIIEISVVGIIVSITVIANAVVHDKTDNSVFSLQSQSSRRVRFKCGTVSEQQISPSPYRAKQMMRKMYQKCIGARMAEEFIKYQMD